MKQEKCDYIIILKLKNNNKFKKTPILTGLKSIYHLPVPSGVVSVAQYFFPCLTFSLFFSYNLLLYFYFSWFSYGICIYLSKLFILMMGFLNLDNFMAYSLAYVVVCLFMCLLICFVIIIHLFLLEYEFFGVFISVRTQPQLCMQLSSNSIDLAEYSLSL